MKNVHTIYKIYKEELINSKDKIYIKTKIEIMIQIVIFFEKF